MLFPEFNIQNSTFKILFRLQQFPQALVRLDYIICVVSCDVPLVFSFGTAVQFYSYRLPGFYLRDILVPAELQGLGSRMRYLILVSTKSSAGVKTRQHHKCQTNKCCNFYGRFSYHSQASLSRFFSDVAVHVSRPQGLYLFVMGNLLSLPKALAVIFIPG